MARCFTRKPAWFLGLLLAVNPCRAGVDYASEIQPIFAEHCADCHGPDTQKAGLNLMDERIIRSPLKSGRRALIEGDPDASELIRRLTTEDADDRMPPPDHGNRLQPVFSLIHRDLASDLRDFLHTGGRKIDLWLDRHVWVLVDFSDPPHMFLNINTPEELVELEKRLQL